MITPRWLYVLAAATPARFGDPVIVDETLALADCATLEPGDVVGIGIHTGNALRGYEIGRQARARGAWVIFGGIHATLYPEEAHQLGGAQMILLQRAGAFCRATATCGRLCKLCAAALSIVLFVPCGAPTGNAPGSAGATP